MIIYHIVIIQYWRILIYLQYDYWYDAWRNIRAFITITIEWYSYFASCECTLDCFQMLLTGIKIIKYHWKIFVIICSERERGISRGFWKLFFFEKYLLASTRRCQRKRLSNGVYDINFHIFLPLFVSVSVCVCLAFHITLSLKLTPLLKFSYFSFLFFDLYIKSSRTTVSCLFNYCLN